jgi:hypothetical protein
MAFTRMPVPPSSEARVLVMETTAALVMPYTPWAMAASKAAMLARLTMEPPRLRSRRTRTTSRVNMK